MEETILPISLTFVLVFSLGLLGYLVFDFFHVPGSALTGSLAIVALFSSQGAAWTGIPPQLSTFFQVVIGITIGCKFSREKSFQLRSLVIPGLFVSAWMLGTGLVCGLLLSRITGLDLGTSLYASVPGGMAEMGLIALSRGLSVPVITLFQFVRVVVVQIAVPVIALTCVSRGKICAKASPEIKNTEEAKGNGFGILITFIIGGCGGLIAKYFQVPVGGLLGAMIIVGTLRTMGFPLKEFPRWVTIAAQVGIGAYLGMTFTPETASNLHKMLLPTLGFSALLVISGMILGLIFHKVFGWDLTTALLACAAAGVTQMSVIALDMEADAVTVGIIQAMRLAAIVILMPTVITVFLGNT